MLPSGASRSSVRRRIIVGLAQLVRPKVGP
jgi:hypothetical protein